MCSSDLHSPLMDTSTGGSGTWGGDGRIPFPIIRVADLYLLYAETLNESASTPPDDAYKYLDLVRKRAGLKGVKEAWQKYSIYPDKPLSKEGLREIIHRERRIELAAEGHRYDDIRRYGLEYCREAMNGESTAPCGGFDPVKKEWQKYVVIDKVWGDRLLLMPIPTSAMDVNPLLKDDQNPGY